jgi:Fe2+ transport system protein B
MYALSMDEKLPSHSSCSARAVIYVALTGVFVAKL